MEESRFNRTSISFLVLGLILGFIIGYVSTDVEEPEHEEDTSSIEESAALVESTDTKQSNVVPVQTVEVKDILVKTVSQAAGNRVVVPTVNTPAVSWIAVREDRNGELWSILGARRVQPGLHQNVSVPLLRNTIPDTLYHVVVYEEDGDGLFDHKADTLVTKDGIFYTSDFTTTE
jgi:hypothetical protein